VLITDEVLAVGDEAFQRRCMERIYRFRRMGKTIVFVSHALEVVRTLCDQAIWLDGGVGRMVGESGQVIDAYLADVNRRERERIERLRRKEANEEEEATEEEAPEETTDDSASLQRFGSREVEIVQVELLDDAGHPRSVFQTHETVVVRMHYEAHEPVEWVIFGFALHHGNGLWLTGPNTSFAGMDLPRLEGAGYIDYIIRDLPLLTGQYLLSVSVYDETLLHAYDHHDRMYQLVVQSRGLRERFGMLTVDASWEWHVGPDEAREQRRIDRERHLG
jgi:lipopolysaccharide transport system ATP-binding protein